MTERFRGPFAGERHTAALEESSAEKARWPSVREADRLKTKVEQAAKTAIRAQNAVFGKQGRARSQAEREAKRLHDEEMLAVVAYKDAILVVAADEFDRVLAETLDVDDHVDLESFRQVAEHPPFESEFSVPIPAPDPVQASQEPVWAPPAKPSGLAGLFGQRHYKEQWSHARAAFEQRWMSWRAEVAQLPTMQFEQLREHQAAEAERQGRLAHDRARNDRDSQLRQAAVDKSNVALDGLITRHRQGEASAVEEYCSIVFESSVYPEEFEPYADFAYNEKEDELAVSLHLPSPDGLPSTRSFKYIKARDEIAEAELPQKEQRERYANLIYSIVLRTMHEQFEADRIGNIAFVSLSAGVEHIDPATGLEVTTPLIAVAVRREDFEALNLAHVTPAETLKHLNAVLSKNALALTPISAPDGVRG